MTPQRDTNELFRRRNRKLAKRLLDRALLHLQALQSCGSAPPTAPQKIP